MSRLNELREHYGKMVRFRGARSRSSTAAIASKRSSSRLDGPLPGVRVGRRLGTSVAGDSGLGLTGSIQPVGVDASVDP
jgi:hypothetical protein